MRIVICDMRIVICDLLIVICDLWYVICDLWSENCVLWTVNCNLWSELWTLICDLWSMIRQNWFSPLVKVQRFWFSATPWFAVLLAVVLPFVLPFVLPVVLPVVLPFVALPFAGGTQHPLQPRAQRKDLKRPETSPRWHITSPQYLNGNMPKYWEKNYQYSDKCQNLRQYPILESPWENFNNMLSQYWEKSHKYIQRPILREESSTSISQRQYLNTISNIERGKPAPVPWEN